MRLLKLVTSAVATVLGAFLALVVTLSMDARKGALSLVAILVSGVVLGVGTWHLFPSDEPKARKPATGDPASWERTFRRRVHGSYAAWVGLLATGIIVHRTTHVGFASLATLGAITLAIPFVFLFLWRCPACGEHLGGFAREITCPSCRTHHSMNDGKGF